MVSISLLGGKLDDMERNYYDNQIIHKHQRYSRAYINFKWPEDVFEFAEFFDGHVFVNEKGSQFKAIVEYAPSQHVPKPGTKKDAREGTIFKDPEYLEFLKMTAKPVENLPSAEIQLERKEAELSGTPKEIHVVTPLMEFVRQRRAAESGVQGSITLRKTGKKAAAATRVKPGSSSKRGSEKKKSVALMASGGETELQGASSPVSAEKWNYESGQCQETSPGHECRIGFGKREARSEKHEKHTRNKNRRPDPGIWTPLLRSDIPQASEEHLTPSVLQSARPTRNPSQGSSRHFAQHPTAHNIKDDGSVTLRNGKSSKRGTTSSGAHEILSLDYQGKNRRAFGLEALPCGLNDPKYLEVDLNHIDLSHGCFFH
ncbi:hypothetical protein V6N13_015898 [Hibiscus sabdariffa]